MAVTKARAAHATRYRRFMPEPRLPCPGTLPQRDGQQRPFGANGAAGSCCVRQRFWRGVRWHGCGPEQPAPAGRTRLGAAAGPCAGSRQRFGRTWRSPFGRRAPAGLVPGEWRLPASRGWLRGQGRPAGRPSAGAPTGAFIPQLNFGCNSCQLNFASMGGAHLPRMADNWPAHTQGGWR
jgi:hypothetical protein